MSDEVEERAADSFEGAEPLPDALAFDVAPEEAGARLDAYLAARVGGASRTTIKRLIEDGDALVGGRQSKPSYKLRAGDRIEVEVAPPPPLRLAPEDIPLDVVYEDDDLIVVNKSAGMVVHPAAGVFSGTLANALAHRISNPQSLRPGIVHRLDRDTSGLIVAAKTAGAQEDLSEQFRAREVFKSYVALVHGRVAADSGRIAEPLGRDPRRRTQMAVVRGGREALTLYRVSRRYERFTLLDAEIKTGRTHQIRVHLAWLKHPVVGDETYNAGRDRNVPDAHVRGMIAKLDRQFLHAARLGFRHPRTGEFLRFDAPLPGELREFLGGLK